jgi:putative ABC transport system permease protein
MIAFLTLKSMKHRWFTTALCVISIALSIALFLGVERLRNGAREGFTNTISQTDLIVGARGGSLQLLLYSVFHIGNPTNNIRYSTFKHFDQHPMVAWTIPMSLGDSYRGHRVVGTNHSFFDHYRYRGQNRIELAQGGRFENIFDVVIGSDIASKFALSLNDPIVLSHGITAEALLNHDNTPFRVVGILAATQTPVDRALYISLEGMEAMHIGWESGVPKQGELADPDTISKDDLEIKQITSFLIGARNRIQVLRLRNEIAHFEQEAIMGIIPGLTLQELWQTMGHVENVLLLISFFVLLVGLIGILISLYHSVQERRREMAILRSLGAGLPHLMALMLSESLSLVILGSALGVGLLYSGLWMIGPYLQEEFSLYLEISFLSLEELKILGLVAIAGVLAGIIPAIKAALNSLQDGLSS